MLKFDDLNNFNTKILQTTTPEGFVCPNDPRSSVVWVFMPLAGLPMANRSYERDQKKCSPTTPYDGLAPRDNRGPLYLGLATCKRGQRGRVHFVLDGS